VIRRIVVQSQPKQILHKILSQKYLTQKGLVERVATVVQGIGLEFKSQYHKKKKE
jgi:NAD(P)H-hydrate repair Nnr-like enzyme with NAD(P)H-hydrate dehydratase domain